MNARDAKRFEAALNAAEPEAELVKLVEAMKREGLSQLEIYCRFTEVYVEAQDANDRRKDDLIADVLDRIWGWCGEHSKLFSQSLDNDQVSQYQATRNAEGKR